MNQMLTGQIMLVAGWLIAVVASILHGVLLKWNTSDLGRQFFFWPLSVAVLLTPNLARILVGDYPGRMTLNLIAYGLFLLVLLRGLYLLVKYYREERKSRRSEGP